MWTGIAKFIRVSRSYKLGRMTPTKTGKVSRVDMSDHLLEALRIPYTWPGKRKPLRDGKGDFIDIIFHRDGKPMEQNYIRRVFKRILVWRGFGRFGCTILGILTPACS
jgi:hypothetical protein